MKTPLAATPPVVPAPQPAAGAKSASGAAAASVTAPPTIHRAEAQREITIDDLRYCTYRPMGGHPCTPQYPGVGSGALADLISGSAKLNEMDKFDLLLNLQVKAKAVKDFAQRLPRDDVKIGQTLTSRRLLIDKYEEGEQHGDLVIEPDLRDNFTDQELKTIIGRVATRLQSKNGDLNLTGEPIEALHDIYIKQLFLELQKSPESPIDPNIDRNPWYLRLAELLRIQSDYKLTENESCTIDSYPLLSPARIDISITANDSRTGHNNDNFSCSFRGEQLLSLEANVGDKKDACMIWNIQLQSEGVRFVKYDPED